MDDCIFCRIVEGRIPCAKVFEDEHTLAFLTIEPVRKGHTLVIPKVHYQTFLELDDDIAGHLTNAVKAVAKKVKAGVNADGLNISTNVNAAAGQVVNHVHMHIIPRNHGDGLSTWHKDSYAEGDMPLWAEKISKA